MCRLPHDRDLITAILEICKEVSVLHGWFTIIGAVKNATYGVYDQSQKVYVTHKENSPQEIIFCGGNVSLKDGAPFVHAHILLGDEKGNTKGGHLFSETIIFAGEMFMQAFSGKPPERVHDLTTDLYLWQE